MRNATIEVALRDDVSKAINMTTWPEDRVLKPLDPVPEDVNEWPDLALREVRIFRQGGARHADLLDASDETPLCVLGELMPLDDELEHLGKCTCFLPRHKSWQRSGLTRVIALIDNVVYSRIKIENVTNYSFGLDDAGTPQIWAAGKAGWYEISPSAKYLQQYNDTVEAIDLFYFMVDQHSKLPKKSQRFGFAVDPFLTEYQKHTGYRINDDDEAMETVHKHHKFLLKQMIEEREGIDWSRTYLWKHLNETYAEEIEQLKITLAQQMEAMELTAPEPEVASEAESSETSADSSNEDESSEEESAEEEESGTTPMSDRKSNHSESESSDDSSESESEPERDWTKTIWDMLNVLRKLPNFNMRTCGIEQLASELIKVPVFEPKQHQTAVKAIERSASELIRLMNEAKLRKKFNWSTRAIYDELEATFAGEVAADTMRTPAAKGNDKRHRMKSVLRPSGASKARKRVRENIDTEDEDELMRDAPSLASAVAKRNHARRLQDTDADSATSREDSPSRQLNGFHDPNALPELPPGPEAQEMLELVSQEAKRVGRHHQTSHLKDFLEQLNFEI